MVALRSDRLDPIRERMHEVVLEYSSAVADELAMFIGMAGVGLGLLHGRHVQKHERLPRTIIRTEGPDRARRAVDDRTGLAVPDTTSAALTHWRNAVLCSGEESVSRY